MISRCVQQLRQPTGLIRRTMAGHGPRQFGDKLPFFPYKKLKSPTPYLACLAVTGASIPIFFANLYKYKENNGITW